MRSYKQEEKVAETGLFFLQFITQINLQLWEKKSVLWDFSSQKCKLTSHNSVFLRIVILCLIIFTFCLSSVFVFFQWTQELWGKVTIIYLLIVLGITIIPYSQSKHVWTKHLWLWFLQGLQYTEMWSFLINTLWKSIASYWNDSNYCRQDGKCNANQFGGHGSSPEGCRGSLTPLKWE